MNLDEAAIDAALRASPFDVVALVMKGDRRMSAGDPRTALAFWQAALREAQKYDRLPADLAPAVAHAERSIRQAGGGFERYLDDTLESAGWPHEQRPPRFQESLEIMAGHRQARMGLQRPGMYFFPGLPQRRYYERQEFAWCAALEARAGTIRTELKQWMRDGGAGFRPYMLNDPERPRSDVHSLVDNPQWSTLYLHENGAQVAAHAQGFPITYATVMALDVPRITTRAPSVLFSRLSPGAHIPPHTGVMNARLVCHLPLIVPDGCGFRVGGETRQWKEGELLVFDDTVEHEAWNHSGTDRVILIFDIWRPELSPDERAAVTALFEAVDAYAA